MRRQTSPGCFSTRTMVNLSGGCNLISSCIFIIYEYPDRSRHGANSAYFWESEGRDWEKWSGKD